MKKVFFMMAIAGMFGFAACNNNKTAEAVEDTTMTVVEAVAEEAEDVIDSAATTVENAVEEVVENVVAE